MPRKSMKVPRDDNGCSCPAVKLGACDTVTIAGTSAQSAALESEVVRAARSRRSIANVGTFMNP